MIEIIETVKVSQSKVYLSEEIKERFNIKDGTKMIWGVTRKGDLVLKKADSISDEYF